MIAESHIVKHLGLSAPHVGTQKGTPSYLGTNGFHDRRMPLGNKSDL